MAATRRAAAATRAAKAKSRRDWRFHEHHRNEIAAKQRAPSGKPRTPLTAPGIVGVYYVPKLSKARPWRAPIGANKRFIHLGMFATTGEAATARAAAERGLREPGGR